MSLLRNEDIFKQKYPVYISGTIFFPLYYQNNGIGTNNSQIRLYLLDRKNVVDYNGMDDEINLFENVNAKYIKNYLVSYDDFTKEIKPRIKVIEKIFENNFSKCNFEKIYYFIDHILVFHIANLINMLIINMKLL